MCSFAVPSSPRHGAALFFLRLGSSPPFFSYTIRDRALRRRWRIVSADRMRRSLGSFCAVLRPSGASLSPCPTTYTTWNRGSLLLESHRDAVWFRAEVESDGLPFNRKHATALLHRKRWNQGGKHRHSARISPDDFGAVLGHEPLPSSTSSVVLWLLSSQRHQWSRMELTPLPNFCGITISKFCICQNICYCQIAFFFVEIPTSDNVGTISVLLVDGSCSLKVIRPVVAQSYTIQILSKAYMESPMLLCLCRTAFAPHWSARSWPRPWREIVFSTNDGWSQEDGWVSCPGAWVGAIKVRHDHRTPS
jgi:hypothetical protein